MPQDSYGNSASCFRDSREVGNPPESEDGEITDEITDLDLDALGPDDDHIDSDKLLEFIENRHKKPQAPKIDYGP